MKRFLTASIAAATVLAAYAPSRAEDIDLFVQPPGTEAGKPNVLIVLDNTANWEQPFTNEISALVSTLNGLAVNADGSAKYRVGLMLFTETGNPNNNVDGGYVRAAIRDMTGDNKTKYLALLNSLHKLNDKSNGGKAGKTMSEVYQYYKGLAPYSGNSKVKTDYKNNNSGTAQSKAIYALDGNALQSFNGNKYTSPLQDGSCAGNYVIYISNGPVQDNASDSTTARNQLQSAATTAGISGATTAIPINPSGSQDNVADEWARFMRKTPLGIKTYTLDVDPGTTGQGPGWTALLKSMANVSGGKYFAASSGNGGAQVAQALGFIFSEIQAVNSVFASVSLPVSVNTQGTYLNQVYIGMFRPDSDGLPRWTGNLKQYKLAPQNNGTVLKTVDADNKLAINSETGFITECARSFWTPTTADSYWTFRPGGDCTMDSINYDNSNYPDGKMVEKGAQAFVRRSTTSRTLRTCSSTFGSCASAGPLIDFNNTNVSQTVLGAASTVERDAIINWARGQDLADENLDGVTTTQMRSTVHGDVVHSRPIAINYGTDGAPKIVVYYGGNDGVFRAVNGNRSSAIGSVPAGQEIWAFVPPEFFGNLKRLRDNNVQINFKGNPTTTPAPQPKPYGLDGGISIHENKWLYVGMRRGGRVLYAFNVEGIVDGTPVAPRLLWKRGCPVNLSGSGTADDSGCSADYSAMGQTWSKPKVMKTSLYKDSGTGALKPLIIMGGGYDPCEDADPASNDCKSGAKGRGVFLIDAETGTRVNFFATDRPVVADVYVVTDDNSGLAQWAYVVDLGGNIYRIGTSSAGIASLPLGNAAPGFWTMTKIASLGCSSPSANCSANRKFMFEPDVVEKDGTLYILLGSGDREKPLNDDYWPNAYDVDNYFFMVKDIPAAADWLESEDDACGSEVICLDSLVEIEQGVDPDKNAIETAKGWYLQLGDHEQVVTSAITVFGNVTFSTHTPADPEPGACTSNLGIAKVYNVNYVNAGPRPGQNLYEEVSGGGLPPSPVAGKVTLDDGTTVPFIIGSEGESPLEGALPSQPPATTQPKSLTYWLIEK